MPTTDSIQKCVLLNRDICRGYCFEVGEVLEDNMDIEHIEDRFDIDEAKKICDECGWYNTPIH